MAAAFDIELVRLTDQPNIHVEACAADPYPPSNRVRARFFPAVGA